jgi:uncharacterized membrane protein
MRKCSMTSVHLRLRKTIDRHIAVVLFIFGILLLLLLISPYLVPTGQLQDLSGKVLSMDNLAQFSGMNPIAWAVYSFGDLNCHQLRDRSFFLNDNQMPVCSRDTGIFIGLFAGAMAMSIFSLSMKKRYLIVGLLPMMIDGALQGATSYQSDNSIRVLTGVLAGVAVAVFICLLVALPQREMESPGTTIRSSGDQKTR